MCMRSWRAERGESSGSRPVTAGRRRYQQLPTCQKIPADNCAWMRLLTRLATTALCAVLFISLLHAAENTSADEQMLRAIYTAALTASPAYEHLRELTTKYPGRLAGSKNLAGAVQ